MDEEHFHWRSSSTKSQVVTLNSVRKVIRVVEVMESTTHNVFPVVDEGKLPGRLGTKVIVLRGLLSKPTLF